MAPTSSFNLIDEPWIPCIAMDGAAAELSLRQVLERAGELREVFDNSPLTTVAVHRPLLALLHRLWEGDSRPQRRQEWAAMWEAKQFPAERLHKYLQERHDRFDLFSEEFPFYQARGLEMAESSPLARLSMEEQLGGMLFAHEENPAWRAPSPALAARLLVTAQSFALGFGISSRAKLNDISIEPPRFRDAVLMRGVTVWLSGQTLFETLMLNLVPVGREYLEDDAPCWEVDDPTKWRDQTADGKRQTEPPHGPMDRFTWQSRLIRLLPEVEVDGNPVVRRLYFTHGRSLPQGDTPDFDPMKSYRSSKGEGFTPVSLNANRAAWRDSHALLHSDDAKGAAGTPSRRAEALDETALRLGLGLVDPSAPYDLHVVGMAAEPGKAGKFLLWRHDRMPVPPALLADELLVQRLHLATEDAEFVAVELGERTRKLCRYFLAPEWDKPGARKPHPDDVARLASEFDPRRAYWPRLEARFHRFVQDLPEGGVDALLRWRGAVEEEASRAFAESSLALGESPRAIRARARVSTRFLTKLNLDKHLTASKARKAARPRASTSSTQETPV